MDGDYIGRQCPARGCKKYFKVKTSTGSLTRTCTCPYCGTTASPQSFHTKDQVEWGKSVVFREVEEEVYKSLRSMEFEVKPPRGGFGVGMSMKVQRGPRPRVRTYREKKLETEVTCSSCQHEFSIFGVYGYCPCCSKYNDLANLLQNLEVIEKMLSLVEEQDDEGTRTTLLESALEACVGKLDGWGREATRIALDKKESSDTSKGISFQNLTGAAKNLRTKFDIDLHSLLEDEELQSLNRLLQKRHLVAHRSGVIDQRYVDATNDHSVPVGRKVRITCDEIRSVLPVISKLASSVKSCLEAQA